MAAIVTIVAVKFHVDRRVYLAGAYSRRAALIQTYNHLGKHGPEITRLYSEMMLLGAYRHSEELLSHPLAPWWPRRTRGSYERVPFWRQPSRLEQLSAIRSDQQEFLIQIGITNRQQTAELFERYVEHMRKANTNLHGSTESRASASSSAP